MNLEVSGLTALSYIPVSQRKSYCLHSEFVEAVD